MFKQTGVITDINQDKMSIKILGMQGCKDCQNIICGQNKQNTLLVNYTPGLEIGDKIEIKVSSKNLALTSIVMFFLPSLIFVIIGYIFRGLNIYWLISIETSILITYFFVMKFTVLKSIEKNTQYQIQKI